MSDTPAVEPLVTRETIRQIALSIHNMHHPDTPEPLEVGAMVLAMWELQKLYEQERAPLLARIAELEAVIAYIDAHAPLADKNCIEPGITLSEATRREMKEKGLL